MKTGNSYNGTVTFTTTGVSLILPRMACTQCLATTHSSSQAYVVTG